MRQITIGWLRFWMVKQKPNRQFRSGGNLLIFVIVAKIYAGRPPLAKAVPSEASFPLCLKPTNRSLAECKQIRQNQIARRGEKLRAFACMLFDLISWENRMAPALQPFGNGPFAKLADR